MYLYTYFVLVWQNGSTWMLAGKLQHIQIECRWCNAVSTMSPDSAVLQHVDAAFIYCFKMQQTVMLHI